MGRAGQRDISSDGLKLKNASFGLNILRTANLREQLCLRKKNNNRVERSAPDFTDSIPEFERMTMS